MSIQGDNCYDVIVVGAGLGGLTAGAILAKSGKKVAVIEQHDRVGGYAQSFKRRGFHFDSSIHFSGGCEPAEEKRLGVIYRILDTLHVADQCSFYRLDPFIRLITPTFTFQVPLGCDRFVEALSVAVGCDPRPLAAFVAKCRAIDDELRRMPHRLNWLQLLSAPFVFPRVVRYGSWTLEKALNRFLPDERARTAFGAFTICFGSMASRTSFLHYAHLFASFFVENASGCTGTFQKLADALALALKSNGGVLLLKKNVRKILVSGRDAAGVELSDGTSVAAPVVISNADMFETYGNLLEGAPAARRVLDTLHQMTPSSSCFCVYIGTNLPADALPPDREMILLDSDIVDECINPAKADVVSHLFVTVPSMADSTIVPQGGHAVILMALMPFREHLPDEERKAITEALIDKASTVIPRLREHMLFCETATPATFKRYTKNYRGAMIGWETTPRQSGTGRPGHRSPVLRGLYHVGHWTNPGGGVYGAMVSGLQTAQIIAGYKRTADLFEALGKDKERTANHP